MSVHITSSSPSIFRAVRLDRAIPQTMRRFLLRLALLLHLFSFVVVGMIIMFRALADSFFGGLLSFFASFNIFILWGGFFLTAFFFYFLLFFEFFYLSSLRPAFIGRRNGDDLYIQFEGARIFQELKLFEGKKSFSLFHAHEALARDTLFRIALLRLGVAPSDYVLFRSENKKNAEAARIQNADFLARMAEYKEEGGNKIIFGSASVARALYESDESFRNFLFNRHGSKEDFIEVLAWVDLGFARLREYSFVWEKKELGRTPGVAKDFGFGYTYTLDQYSYDFEGNAEELSLASRKRSIDAIETILSKAGEANVLLVGREGTGKETVLQGLATRIKRGIVSPYLEYKRMVRLDIDSIIASTKTKGMFEEKILRILKEAVEAGNIILVLEDLPHAITSAENIGSDFITLCEPAFAGSALQVIALADPYGYHKILESQGKIQMLFSKIDVHETDEKETLLILEEIAPILEYRSSAFFTYQALSRINRIASRFIQTGAMPEKAVNLADEVMAWARGQGKQTITPSDVDTFASQKLKIPLGEAETKEKETLLDLESLLHLRIINQEEAIKTIADTMRRARAGIRSAKRPIGSFLFLGPTGVGKTESAKALAAVYFKGEDRMIRFDMSEFHDEEGIRKMIGSFDGTEPGQFSRQARDNPFALFLFDEIEKASREVLNLFLQILEEGFFSDGKGERISMREAILIATSNAGASLIWDLLKEGKDPSSVKKEVIDIIQREGIISPELLNRFDGIVVFHPLSESQLEAVARLLLQGLVGRLKEKDMEFEISDALVKKVVEIGFNPSFGARPMRRAIADRIESYLAKKILGGDLKRGDTIRFSDEEINNL